MIAALKGSNTEKSLSKIMYSHRITIHEKNSEIFYDVFSDIGIGVVEYAKEVVKLEILFKTLKESGFSNSLFLNIKLSKEDYDQQYINFISNLLEEQLRNSHKIFPKEILFLFYHKHPRVPHP